MNINIKNCEVKIISGTDTLEINGGTQPAEAASSAIRINRRTGRILFIGA